MNFLGKLNLCSGFYMKNFRKVNENDIMSSWMRFREDELLCCLDDDYKKHTIQFEEISEEELLNWMKENKNL